MSRARELSKLGNLNVLSADDVSNEVGIASTVPRSTLDVRGELQVGTGIQVGPAGVITASSFDGALGGNIVAAACTFTTGNFTGNVTIGGTLTYEDVTNVDALGIVTARAGVNVSGGQIQVGTAFSVGNAGVATAAGFVGPLTGNVTGNASGTAGGLSGTPNISCGTIAGSTGTFTGDVDIADKIVHTGDTNTALRFPGADTITAETGGSERLRITSTGFVGVNETSPACQLHVEQDVAHASTFWLNSDAGIMIDNKNSTANTPRRVLKLEGDAAIVYGSTDTGDLLFNQRENTVLTLSEKKRVGVGTTNPSFKLDVYEASDSGLRIRSGDASSDVALSVGSAGTPDQFIIQSGGYIGINQSSPRGILDVFETITGSGTTIRVGNTNTPSSANNRRIEFVDGTGLTEGTNKFTYGYIQGFRAGGSNSGDLIFGTKRSNGAAPVEAMRIDDSGYLGINTTSPTTYLDVFGGSDSIEVGNQSGSGRFGADGTSTKIGSHTNHHFDVFTNSSSNRRLRITSGGGFLFDNGELVESCNITAGKLSDNTNIDLEDGMVHYFTTQESTTCTPNIRVSSSTSLNDVMGAGDVVTVTLVTTAAAGGYSANVTIDGNAVTEEWVGGEAPSEGGENGLDIYVYTIICIHASNTGDSGFKVIANKVNAT